MRSQIEGLANLISDSYENFDLKLKSIFKNLPIELIPTSSFAYSNLSLLKIEKNTILISCGKKSVKASVYLKRKFKDLIFNIHIQDPKINYKLFDLKTILNEIKFLSNEFKVNVIPSRRTPRELIEELSKIDNKNIVTFDDLFNPRKYGELLSEGNLQVVTWDSISMISEAISSEAGTFLFKFEEKFCPKRYLKFFDKITKLNLAKFYNQNLKPYEIHIDDYNKNLKTKILNKIQSNLRFRSNNA